MIRELGWQSGMEKAAALALSSRVKRSLQLMFKDHGLPANTPYVVAAGSALYFHGLRPGIRDIDVHVPALPVPHADKVYAGMEVDAMPTWSVGSSADLFRNSVVIDGIRVMGLKSLLAMKKAMNRPKDQADIVAIRKAMGMDKNAEVDGVSIAMGLGAAGFGGLAIYDLLKARGMTEAGEKIVDAIRNKKQVDSLKFVRKFDKKIKVLSTYPALERAMVSELGDWRGKMTAKGMWPSIRDSSNAFAMRGLKGEYIGAGRRCNAQVLAHEIGHIYDFRAKNITWKNMGPYKSGITSMFWRPSYDRSTMAAEREAWKLAPGRKKELAAERDALSTYDKGFHLQRGTLAGGVSLMILSTMLEDH